MKKTILKTFLLIFPLILAACPKNDDSSSSGIFSSDQTAEAVQLITEANVDLKKIKELFNNNEPRLKELQTAMGDKDEKKVKEISDALVYQINDGMALGEKAVEKIAKAQQLNIHNDFKEYLNLKEISLRRYLEAFELRRQLARLLRDGYNPQDPKQREAVVGEFKASEEKFRKIMEDARAISDRANMLAKESFQRKE